MTICPLLEKSFDDEEFERLFNSAEDEDKPDVLADFVGAMFEVLYSKSNGAVSRKEIDEAIKVYRRLVNDIDLVARS